MGMFGGKTPAVEALREDLAEAYRAEGQTRLGVSLTVMNEELASDEQVQAIAGASLLRAAGSMSTGVLAITDRRVFFAGEWTGTRARVDVPLRSITGVDVRIIFKGATVTLLAADGGHTFSCPKREWERLGPTLDRLRSQQASMDPDSTIASTGTSGLAAEIAKLSSLHASGALTDAEFQAAKARLLS